MRIGGILFLVIVFIFVLLWYHPGILGKILPRPITYRAGNTFTTIPCDSLNLGRYYEQYIGLRDTLTQKESLMLKHSDSGGMIWLGINPQCENMVIFYDFFQDCSCGSDAFVLWRYNPDINGLLRLVNRRKMTWNLYYLFLQENYKQMPDNNMET
nr:hypothetical protein [candidate division Zixibacteria bacterium]